MMRRLAMPWWLIGIITLLFTVACGGNTGLTPTMTGAGKDSGGTSDSFRGLNIDGEEDGGADGESTVNEVDENGDESSNEADENDPDPVAINRCELPERTPKEVAPELQLLGWSPPTGNTGGEVVQEIIKDCEFDNKYVICAMGTKGDVPGERPLGCTEYEGELPEQLNKSGLADNPNNKFNFGICQQYAAEMTQKLVPDVNIQRFQCFKSIHFDPTIEQSAANPGLGRPEFKGN